MQKKILNKLLNEEELTTEEKEIGHPTSSCFADWKNG